MKRTIRLLIILSVAALLAACSGNGAAATAQPTGQGSDETRLILGTLQLREGEQAVDAAQAAELLPLWKAYRTLSQSDSTSDAERSALLQQIREAMRPDQLTAIDAQTMGAESRAALAAELGLEMPEGGMGDLSQEEMATRMSTRVAERGADPAAMQAGGPAGGGMMPPGGGGAPGGGAIAFGPGGPQGYTEGGASVRGSAPGRANMLLDALISYLEEIA